MSIIALATPQWIVQDLHGTVTYGLTTICKRPPFSGENDIVCDDDDDVPGPWTAALVFIAFGTVFIAISAVEAVRTFTNSKRLNNSKWFGLGASVAFCFATLIFPAGFDHQGIGGTTYRLPENARIGFAYILFILALLFIFFAEMLTLKLLFEQDV